MLTLLLGQHAALAHFAEHHSSLESRLPISIEGDADTRAPQCDFDGLYVQVLGGACSDARETGALPGPDRRDLEPRGLRLPADLPAHRSRDPPVLS